MAPKTGTFIPGQRSYPARILVAMLLTAIATGCGDGSLRAVAPDAVDPAADRVSPAAAGAKLTKEQALKRLRELEVETYPLDEAGTTWDIKVIGSVTYAYRVPKEMFYRLLTALGRVEGLFLDDLGGDADLQYASRLPGLKRLGLNGEVTDAGASFVPKIPELEELTLRADWSVPSRLTPAGFAAIGEATGLRRLVLHGPDVTDKGIACLTALTGLRELELSGPFGDPAAEVVPAFLKLERLELLGREMTPTALEAVLDAQSLRRMAISARLLEGSGADRLKRLPDLEELYLGDGEAITDAMLADLAELEGLTYLYVQRAEISDAGVAHLARLPRLRTLFLDFTPVSDAALRHLEGMTSLRSVTLHGTRTTPEGRRRLAAAIPGLTIQPADR